MKTKVQAQRKFAQGAFVPPTPVVTERRTIEPQHEVKVINHANVTAKKILDSVTFSHPGMHLHTARVFLERLDYTSFKSGATPSTSAEPGTKKLSRIGKPKQNNPNKSTRILRSMRSRLESLSETNNSDDDRPLTYHLAKKGNGSARSGSRKRKPIKVQRQKTATCTVSKKRKQEVPAKQSRKKRPKEPHGEENSVTQCLNSVCAALIEQDDDPVRLNPVLEELTLVSKKRKQEVPAKQSRVPAKQYRKKKPKEPHGEENSVTQCLNSVCAALLEQNDDPVRLNPVLEELTLDDDPVRLNPVIEEIKLDDDPVLRRSQHLQAFQREPIGDADVMVRVINAAQEDFSDDDQITPCESPPLHLHYDDEITPCQSPSLHLNYDDQITPCESPSLYPNYACNDMSPSESPALDPVHGPFLIDDDDSCIIKEETTPNPASGIIKEETAPISEVDYAIPSSSHNNDEDPLGTNDGWPEEPLSSTDFDGTTPAAVFCPTEDEFKDPLQYYQKIAPIASRFGICKIIAPASFKPQCKTTGLVNISVNVQYPARFFKRWGDGVRELCAIKTYLASHSVYMNKIPVLQGREINLPAIFRCVHKYGGFLEVTKKKLWKKIADELHLFTISKPDRRLDQLYLKFMLPYDILTDAERAAIKANIEAKWQRKQQLLQKRADNPLHMRKVYLCESDESSDEFGADESIHLRQAFRDIEECMSRFRGFSLAGFKQQSDRTNRTYFPGGKPSLNAIEALYWEKVIQATDHECTHTASVDTSVFGYGFTTDPTDPMSQHGWNLKNVRKNKANILRSLGAVVSTTVPILHLGMLFATNCWHRDPHCLPWVEYLHRGQGKIWYGVPEHEDAKFRRAVERLCPTSVQNKKIWLPSDITMIPPKLLLDEGVVLTKLIQKPGEYVFVFPRAYSSSICAGFNISESVYFAVDPWQTTIQQVFQELRDNSEPLNFSPEQLLMAIARDVRVSRDLLRQIYPALYNIVKEEIRTRQALMNKGVLKVSYGRKPTKPYNIREEAECNVCRRPLYMSKVTIKNYKNLKQACPPDAYKILSKLGEPPETSDSSARSMLFVLDITMYDSELKRILSSCHKRIA